MDVNDVDTNDHMAKLAELVDCTFDPVAYNRVFMDEDGRPVAFALLQCASSFYASDHLMSVGEEVLSEELRVGTDVDEGSRFGVIVADMAEQTTRHAAMVAKLQEIRPRLVELGVFQEVRADG